MWSTRDFALMAEAGINTVRVFTVPPVWLLDAAEQAGLKVLVGLPWSQHVAFLDSAAVAGADPRRGDRRGARLRAASGGLRLSDRQRDPARHGPLAWRRAGASGFSRSLVALVKAEHPGALVSYANFPSTEYLTVDFTDFLCFNVYLHDEAAFRRYVARLHNLAVDQPLVLTEFGVNSMQRGRGGAARASCRGRSTPRSRPGSPAPSSSPGPTNGSPAVT